MNNQIDKKAADNTQYKKLAISVRGKLKVTTKPTFHIATVMHNLKTAPIERCAIQSVSLPC